MLDVYDHIMRHLNNIGGIPCGCYPREGREDDLGLSAPHAAMGMIKDEDIYFYHGEVITDAPIVNKKKMRASAALESGIGNLNCIDSECRNILKSLMRAELELNGNTELYKQADDLLEKYYEQHRLWKAEREKLYSIHRAELDAQKERRKMEKGVKDSVKVENYRAKLERQFRERQEFKEAKQKEKEVEQLRVLGERYICPNEGCGYVIDGLYFKASKTTMCAKCKRSWVYMFKPTDPSIQTTMSLPHQCVRSIREGFNLLENMKVVCNHCKVPLSLSVTYRKESGYLVEVSTCNCKNSEKI